MAMSEPLSGLRLSSPPPPPPPPTSSSPDDGVSMNADEDEDDAIDYFGDYAGLSDREEDELREREWSALMAMQGQQQQQQGQHGGKKRASPWDTMGNPRGPPLSEEDFNGNGSGG